MSSSDPLIRKPTDADLGLIHMFTHKRMPMPTDGQISQLRQTDEAAGRQRAQSYRASVNQLLPETTSSQALPSGATSWKRERDRGWVMSSLASPVAGGSHQRSSIGHGPTQAWTGMKS